MPVKYLGCPVVKKYHLCNKEIIHTFGSGDSFWKLANQYYGDPKYWYIIARFNNAPTEASISIGDQIRIPISLSLALQVVV